MSERRLLTDVRMDSFGRFHDRRVGPFQAGLNVVYGPNEVGKSSTMECIRQVLYGWTQSNRNSQRNDYAPREGKRQGRLYLTDGTGEWELARRGKDTSVTTLHGLPWDDAFEDLTGEVSKETYGSIFSFTADDLQRMEQGADDMTASLLTAGSGTRKVPMEVLQNISERMLDYDSPRRTDAGTFRNLGTAIDEMRRRIAELSDEAARYEQEHLELARIVDEEEKLSAAKDADVEHRSQLERSRTALINARDERERVRTALQAKTAELEEARGRAEAARLTEQQMHILETAQRRENAYASLASLQSAYDRSVERHAELEKLKDQLAALQTYGCDIGFGVKQELADRQEKRTALETACSTAERAVRDAEADQAAAQEGSRAHAERTAPARRPLDIVFIAAGLLGLVVAVAVAVLGVGQGVTTLAVSAGIVLGVVSLLLCVMGILHLTGGRATGATTEAQVRLETANEAVVRAHQHRISAQRDLDDFNEGSRRYLEEHGFGAAEGSLGHAQKMLEAQEHVEEDRRRVAAKSESWSEAVDETDQVMARIRDRLSGDALVAGMSAPEMLEWLPRMHAQLQGVRERQHALDAATAERDRLLGEEARLRERLNTVDRRMHELLEDVGLAEDDDFAEVLQQRIVALQGRVREATERIGVMDRRRGELKTILETAAADGELQHAREKLEGLLATRERRAGEYAELVVAQHLMEDAISRWEQEKQPEVYRIASRFFSDMTGGLWHRVDTDGTGIFVEGAGREVLTPEKLSTGTRQQLYLSLRIALLLLAEDVGRDLPVLADDILVHFDEERREGAVRAVRELAGYRQVILFTCHRSTRDLFREMAPQANIMELGV